MALILSGDSPSLSGTYQGGAVTSGTAQASTSGTSIDFTSIPSWVKRVTVNFSAVSSNGSSAFIVQTGAGSVQTTGYLSGTWSGASTNTQISTGLIICPSNASFGFTGVMIINHIGSNLWTASCLSNIVTTANIGYQSVGSVTVAGTLDRIRFTTVNGTDTFDAGTINILYE
jgi:hypothetical protein